MQIRLWLILLTIALGAGCAPGYYAARPAYPKIEADSTRWGSVSWQNPETEAEQQMRIWRMESGR